MRVAVRATGDDWSCEAVLGPPLSDEDREGFEFLVKLEPLFTLCFDEESMLLVHVVAAADDGRLVRSAHEGDAAESAGSR